MADIVLFVSSAVLGLTFAWSATFKLLRFKAWREAIAVYGFPVGLRNAALPLVPIVELAVIAILVLGRYPAAGALSLALLAAFCGALLRARSREGDRLPCGCFGGTERRDYRLLLLRNVALMVPALLLILTSRRSPAGLPPAGDVIPAALIVAGVLMLGWMGSQVMSSLRQKGPR